MISATCRGKDSQRNTPEYAGSFHTINNGKTDCEDNTYDVIVSIEVMEHVQDLHAYLEDINRLLKPKGHFIWTTPCANQLSIEHIYSLITQKIELTSEGYVRWSWEDPTHLRRLKSDEVIKALRANGFSNIHLRFRAHFFSFLCTYLPCRNRLEGLRNKMMCLDYILFKALPNGASMIGIARKK